MPHQGEAFESSANGVDTSKPRGLDKSNETNGRRVPLIGDRPSRTVRCDHDGEAPSLRRTRKVSGSEVGRLDHLDCLDGEGAVATQEDATRMCSND